MLDLGYLDIMKLASPWQHKQCILTLSTTMTYYVGCQGNSAKYVVLAQVGMNFHLAL